MPVRRERVSVLHNIMQGAPARGTGDGCRAAWGDFAVLRTALSASGGRISADDGFFLTQNRCCSMLYVTIYRKEILASGRLRYAPYSAHT